VKWVGRGLAGLFFAALLVYGASRFLAASELRAAMADAERACDGRGGVQEFEVEDSGALRADCADGTAIS